MGKYSNLNFFYFFFYKKYTLWLKWYLDFYGRSYAKFFEQSVSLSFKTLMTRYLYETTTDGFQQGVWRRDEAGVLSN